MMHRAARLDGFPRWPIFAAANLAALLLAYAEPILTWIDEALDVWGDE